jgi:hypothetical protein
MHTCILYHGHCILTNSDRTMLTNNHLPPSHPSPMCCSDVALNTTAQRIPLAILGIPGAHSLASRRTCRRERASDNDIIVFGLRLHQRLDDDRARVRAEHRSAGLTGVLV